MVVLVSKHCWAFLSLSKPLGDFGELGELGGSVEFFDFLNYDGL